MELTFEQQRAARACGFSFFPATETQVQRFTMQRRIFWLGGQPFMVTRDGAFWETHGTLMHLIPEQGSDAPQPATREPEPLPRPEQATKGTEVPSPPVAVQLAEAEPAPPEENACPPARTKRRRRTKAEGAPHRDNGNAAIDAETPLAEHATACAPEAVETAGEVPREAEDRPESTARRPRARQPKEPRWATAGKERRGRAR